LPKKSVVDLGAYWDMALNTGFYEKGGLMVSYCLTDKISSFFLER